MPRQWSLRSPTASPRASSQLRLLDGLAGRQLAQSQATAARHPAFALDLVLRDPAIHSLTVPQVGLATGKKAYLVLAAGGIYSSGPAAPKNHAEPYLKTVLGFLGIELVETVYVEGVAYGPEAAEKAIAAAHAKVAELALAA